MYFYIINKNNLAKAGKVISGKPGIFTSTTTNNNRKQQDGKSPQFLQKLTSINARQGQNVKLVAEIDGQPMPTIQWLFNGKPITNGAIKVIFFGKVMFFLKISLIGNKALLEIPRIQSQLAGSYVCTLRNHLGTAQSEARIDIPK